MDNFDLVDFLKAGGLNKPVELLKEDMAPGFADRKQGGPLPTLESVKAAHQAKKGIAERNDYADAKEGMTDRETMEKIFDIISYHDLDPSEVLEEIGQEYGIDFEFNLDTGRERR
jgi:hypothetical protein